MSAPHRRTVLIAVAAVLGIVLAAAITWGTSQLVRQRIGLASEPLTVGRRLLPPAAHRTPARSTRTSGPARRSNSTRTSTSVPSTTKSSTPAATTAPPVAVREPAPEPSPPESAPAERSPSRSGSARDGGGGEGGGGDSSSHRDD
jgi:hypothetical protein